MVEKDIYTFNNQIVIMDTLLSKMENYTEILRSLATIMTAISFVFTMQKDVPRASICWNITAGLLWLYIIQRQG